MGVSRAGVGAALTTAAGTVTLQVFADTLPVYILPFRPTLTVWPSSAPLVVPEMVTGELSSTALMMSSPATVEITIIGGAWSLRVAVLFDWVVEAALPAASKMAVAAGLTVRTSLPFGVPVRER